LKIRKDELKKLEDLSILLDHKFSGPLGMKYGLDAVIGLIPGLGDLITTGFSLYILSIAVSLGAGPSIILRMGTNILIESVIDLIPIVGNIFDFYWKANLKNLELLKRHIESPVREAIKSRVILSLIAIGLISILVLSVVLTIRFIKFIFQDVSS
jgi:hypothetical protein